MKKYLILFLLVILLVPIIMISAQVEIENPVTSDSLWELLSRVIDFIFYISISIASLMIIIGAYFFLTSAGEPGKVQTAKNVILYALIGLAVVFLSKAIINLLLEIFGVEASI
jgi:hypothetical protein